MLWANLFQSAGDGVGGRSKQRPNSDQRPMGKLQQV
jgi:hypothetical protein